MHGEPAAGRYLREAIEHADAQGANFWLEVDRLLLGAAEGPEALNREVRRLGDGSSVYLSVVAESLVDRLTELGDDEIWHWFGARWEVDENVGFRRLREADPEVQTLLFPPARCLDELGVPEDVSRLRRFSKRRSGRS